MYPVLNKTNKHIFSLLWVVLNLIKECTGCHPLNKMAPKYEIFIEVDMKRGLLIRKF